MTEFGHANRLKMYLKRLNNAGFADKAKKKVSSVVIADG